MPRTLTAAGRAALQAGTIKPVYLLEAITDEGTQRINTWSKGLSYDGDWYDGAPDGWELPDGIPLARTLSPEAFIMLFNGAYEEDTSSFLGLLLTRSWHQRPVNFFGLLIDLNDGSVIDKFYEWRGRIDRITVERNEGGVSIARVACESGVFRALDVNNSTLSHNDQIRRHPSDTMLRNMVRKQGQQIPYGVSWSKVPGFGTSGGSNYGGGGGGGGFRFGDQFGGFGR